MPQQIDFNGSIHEFPDDFTQQEISTALQSMQGYGPRSPNQTGVPMFPGIIAPNDRPKGARMMKSGALAPGTAVRNPAEVMGKSGDWRDTALDVGVGVAGTAGGIAGLPLGVPSSIGLAGMTSAEAGMLADMLRAKMGTPRAPQNASQFSQNAAWNLATGAVAQGAGEALNAARAAYVPAAARASFPKNMSASYEKNWGHAVPRPWEEVLKDTSLPVPSATGKAAMNARTSLSAEAQRTIEWRAKDASAEDLLGKIIAKRDELARISPENAADVADLDRFIESFRKGMVPEPKPSGLLDASGKPYPTPARPPRIIPGKDLAPMGRYAARIAKPAIQTSEVGAAAVAASPNTQLANEALSEEITKRLKAELPGLDAARKTTQRNMALRSALSEAWRNRPANAPLWEHLRSIGIGAGGSAIGVATGHPGLAVGGVLPELGVIAGQTFRDPTFLMNSARALNTPAAEAIARTSPQLPAWFLRSLLSTPYPARPTQNPLAAPPDSTR